MIRLLASITLLALLAAAPARGEASALLQDDARVRALARQIDESKDQTPREVFEELGKMKTGASYLALKNALRDLDRPTAKRWVYSALRHMVTDPELGPKALALVTKAARGRDRPEARAAAGALAGFGAPGFDAMVEVARHAADDQARASALRGALDRLGRDGTRESLDVILGAVAVPGSGRRDVVLEVLTRFRTEEAFAAFTKAVSGKDSPLGRVRLVLAAMGRHGAGADAVIDEGADRVLSKAASSRDPILQYYALNAMAQRGGTANVRLVERLAGAKDPAVRRAALLVGMRARLKGADPFALALSKDAIARQAAAFALAEEPGERGRDALHGLIEDEDLVVRATAIRQVAARGDLASVDALIARLGLEEGRLRGDLRSALESLTGRDYGLNARVWGKFWAAERRGYVPPTPEERAAAAAARAEREAKNGSRVAFYGIDIVSTRFALVIDTSGSMGTEAYTGQTRLAVAKKQLGLTLERLRDGVLFNVVPFSGGVEEMESRMIELDEESRAEAIEFADALRPGGGTNIHDALELAFEDERVDTIYLLSDGAPSTGPIVQPQELRDEVARWNSVRGVVIHCIAVGQDHQLLRGLAADSGGKYVRVN